MNKIIALLVLILIGAGVVWYTKKAEPVASPIVESQPISEEVKKEDAATAMATLPPNVLGKSVEGRDIGVYHFGTGEKEVVFVGGIHGGYSWNTALVAFELKEYLEKNPTAIPASLKVTVIPVLNPDGLNLVTGTTSRFTKADVASSETIRTSGRFNAHRVDLNRNFDCEWKAEGTWQNTKVSGGISAFSEPETQAFRTYVEKNKPAAVVVWYSAAGGVFPSRCDNGPSSQTLALTEAYAKASGYKAFADFDFYEVTGDMPNWLSTLNIPAISVLLTTHEDTEWSKNQKGIAAILTYLTR